MPVPAKPIHVLVVFYSRRGETEKLALAAGVGAIQARGLIRLRRLHDFADEETIARDAQWSAERARMKTDYIAPRPADAEWADVIIVAAPKDRPEEMAAYRAALQGLDAKVAAIPDSAGTDAACEFGKRVTEQLLTAHRLTELGGR